MKASLATAGAGMLAGCIQSAPIIGSQQNPPACPDIDHIDDDGMAWVNKGPTTVWLSEVWYPEEAASSDGQQYDNEDVYGQEGDEERSVYDLFHPEVTASGVVGQGKIEFKKPGKYTFDYTARLEGLTWVEQPRSLMTLVYKEEPFKKYRVARNEDVIAGKHYPYDPEEPMSMTFEIEEPGTYRYAFGPASGVFLPEEWFPYVMSEDRAPLKLGLRFRGHGETEGAFDWVYPELPQHVGIHVGYENIMAFAYHPVETDCNFDYR